MVSDRSELGIELAPDRRYSQLSIHTEFRAKEEPWPTFDLAGSSGAAGLS